MRKLVTMLVAVGFVFGAAVQASASTIDISGSLTIGFGSVPPTTAVGAGTVSISTPVADPDHLSGLWMPAGILVFDHAVIPITDPGVSFNLRAAILSLSNTSGHFAENSSASTPIGFPGGGWGGVQGASGVANLCLLADPTGVPATCPLQLVLPVQSGGGAGVGIGGTITASETSPLAIAVTVKADRWFQRQITLQSGMFNADRTHTGNEPGYGVTAFTVNDLGFVHGPNSAAWTSAAATSGVIQLISPLEIMVNLGGSTFVPGFAIMRVHFVPEPGTLLLIGSGIAGVVLLGRKRMKK